jgi:hypothetical protein
MWEFSEVLILSLLEAIQRHLRITDVVAGTTRSSLSRPMVTCGARIAPDRAVDIRDGETSAVEAIGVTVPTIRSYPCPYVSLDDCTGVRGVNRCI